MAVSGYCPDCEERQPITPTGEKQAATGTSEWWRIVAHRNKKDGDWCLGSGKLI